MPRITINHITFDPDGPALAAAGDVPEPGAPSHVLVQTTAPLTRPQREQFAQAGLRILEYVEQDTYLCASEPGALAAARTLPYVRWAGAYSRGFKLAPALTGLPAAGGTMSLQRALARPPRPFSRSPRTVDVVLHEDAPAEAVRDKLAAAVRQDPGDLTMGVRKIRITVTEDRLDDLAAMDEVRHIEEAPVYKLHNNIARGLLGVEPQTGNAPLEGAGQVVAVADTGFDRGSTSDVHPAFTGRVARLYALGRSGNANDPDGHGTHVAGSVLGDGPSSTLGLRVRGTAPKASLVLQSVLDSGGGLGGLPDDLNDLFAVPYRQDRARVHTNSWGSVNGDGVYNSNSREVDNFVWNNRDCVICFAAGNEGSDGDADGVVDPGSVTPPGTAKNCITVGASENNRPDRTVTYGRGWPDDFPAGPIAADRVADNPEGMVGFSSRGPVRGGRIKPDVVAPGTFVLSTKSRTAAGDGWAASDDPLYFFLGGTSMATPLVAGCAAVAREFLIARGIANPSAAMVKALLINGARNLRGQYVPSESGALPNVSEGFGRVDMASIFDAGPTLVMRDENRQLDTGDEDELRVDLAAAASLKITLVWTDPPGEALQNDLDLIVRANGQERHGNAAAGSAGFDRINNVEQVEWTGLAAGSVTVLVRANRITTLPQPYALVVRRF